MKRLVFALAATMAISQACASKQATENNDPPGLEGPETSIHFINMPDSILGWQANGENGLWIQDIRKQWYYARVMAPCTGLEFAVELGFKNRGMDQLDRFSEVIVPGGTGRCQIQSLRKSAPPPKGKHHKDVKAVQDDK